MAPWTSGKEDDVLGATHPKWVAYQNIFAGVVWSIYALSTAILFAMAVRQTFCKANYWRFWLTLKTFFGCVF